MLKYRVIVVAAALGIVAGCSEPATVPEPTPAPPADTVVIITPPEATTPPVKPRKHRRHHRRYVANPAISMSAEVSVQGCYTPPATVLCPCGSSSPSPLDGMIQAP